jgi:hypothetical protein
MLVVAGQWGVVVLCCVVVWCVVLYCVVLWLGVTDRGSYYGR